MPTFSADWATSSLRCKLGLALGSIALWEAISSIAWIFSYINIFVFRFTLPLISGSLLIMGYYGYIKSKTYFRNSVFFGSIFSIIFHLSEIFFSFASYYIFYFHIHDFIILFVSIILSILIIINWTELE